MMPEIEPHIRAEIERRLAAIEAGDGARILMAIESGSRGWGFPSPDSDYDVRFLYVRPRDWYLSLMPGRDVIEQPIVDEIDLNGWDAKKALGLLLKSNAVVSEWMQSPIRYRPDDPFVARLATLADALFDPRAVAMHYARTGRQAAARAGDAEEVQAKVYLYILRPALAIRAIARGGGRPAMNLCSLVDAADVPPPLARAISELVEAKQRVKEKAVVPRIPELDAYMAAAFALAETLPARPLPKHARAMADDLFRELVNR